MQITKEFADFSSIRKGGRVAANSLEIGKSIIDNRNYPGDFIVIIFTITI